MIFRRGELDPLFRNGDGKSRNKIKSQRVAEAIRNFKNIPFMHIKRKIKRKMNERKGNFQIVLENTMSVKNNGIGRVGIKNRETRFPQDKQQRYLSKSVQKKKSTRHGRIECDKMEEKSLSATLD